jgi:hypothetical protein
MNRDSHGYAFRQADDRSGEPTIASAEAAAAATSSKLPLSTSYVGKPRWHLRYPIFSYLGDALPTCNDGVIGLHGSLMGGFDFLFAC